MQHRVKARKWGSQASTVLGVGAGGRGQEGMRGAGGRFSAPSSPADAGCTSSPELP